MDAVHKAAVFSWRERGLCYLSIPKTAFTSIRFALYEARGMAPVEADADAVHSIRWPEDTDFSQVRALCSSLFAFAVVREPTSRLVSCFKQKVNPRNIHDLTAKHPQIKPDTPFKQFVDAICATPDEQCDWHVAGQVYLLSDAQGMVPANILHFEYISEQWKPIALKFHLPNLLKLNTSRPRQVDCPQPLRKRIEKRFEQDYDVFYSGLK